MAVFHYIFESKTLIKIKIHQYIKCAGFLLWIWKILHLSGNFYTDTVRDKCRVWSKSINQFNKPYDVTFMKHWLLQSITIWSSFSMIRIRLSQCRQLVLVPVYVMFQLVHCFLYAFCKWRYIINCFYFRLFQFHPPVFHLQYYCFYITIFKYK